MIKHKRKNSNTALGAIGAEYISTKDTAKYIRAALKKAFPGVKFSVTSKTYSGGSSINVSWTDGPTEKQVDNITSFYSGASFDGMIDMKSYHDSSFIDENGNYRNVSWGADYVFANRYYSNAYTSEIHHDIDLRGNYIPNGKEITETLLNRGIRRSPYANMSYTITQDGKYILHSDYEHALYFKDIVKSLNNLGYYAFFDKDPTGESKFALVFKAKPSSKKKGISGTSYFGNPNVTRGIRNNNPGNLVITSENWKGKIIPSGDEKFEQFTSMEYGLRAMLIDIIGDIVRKKLNTLTKLINEYAPASDGNNTASYINTVAKKVGIDANSPLPVTNDFLVKLIKAKIEVENGNDAKYASESQIRTALTMVNDSTANLLAEARSSGDFNTTYTASVFNSKTLLYAGAGVVAFYLLKKING